MEEVQVDHHLDLPMGEIAEVLQVNPLPALMLVREDRLLELALEPHLTAREVLQQDQQLARMLPMVEVLLAVVLVLLPMEESGNYLAPKGFKVI
jgi:hypothetical protein